MTVTLGELKGQRGATMKENKADNKKGRLVIDGSLSIYDVNNIREKS